MEEFSGVTEAFSYTGKCIAERLLALGQPIKTLTRRPPADPDKRLSVAPPDFADHNSLKQGDPEPGIKDQARGSPRS